MAPAPELALQARKIKMKIENAFLKFAGLVLLATALAKIVMVLGGSRVLAEPDPLLTWFTNRQMLFLAALLELMVVWTICKFDLVPALASTAWIASVFLAYRFLLWSSGFKGFCRCLGSITEALGVGPEAADRLAAFILGFLLIGSYGSLIRIALDGKFRRLSRAQTAD